MDWDTTDPDTPTVVRKTPKGDVGFNKGASLRCGAPVPPGVDINGRYYRQPEPEEKHGCLHSCFFKFIVAIVLINLFFLGPSCIRTRINTWNYNHESFEWPTSGIAVLLPQPESNMGVIESNTDSRFEAELRNATATDYSDYVAACKDKGFSLDSSSNSYGYTAYNSDGYKLSVTFEYYDDELNIYLYAPTKMQEVVWPTTGLGALVPAPESTKGIITTDGSNSFAATIGDTDKTAFNTYIDTCTAAGYSVDYERTIDSYENSYSAENADGVRLEISYEGGNVIKIEVRAPYKNNAEVKSTETEPAEEDALAVTQDDAAETDTTESESADAVSAAQDSGLVTTSFKDAASRVKAGVAQVSDGNNSGVDSTGSDEGEND